MRRVANHYKEEEKEEEEEEEEKEEEETRIASDGHPYTKGDSIDYYGGTREWDRAGARAAVCGGGDAEPGRNWVERADGSREDLGATGSAEMRPGDAFVILTPGGGGYGA